MNGEKKAIALKIHERVAMGETWRFASKAFGVQVGTARRWCDELGLPSATELARPVKLAEAKWAYDFVAAGGTWEEAGEQTGTNWYTLRTRCLEILGLPPLGPKPAPHEERKERLMAAMVAFIGGVDQVNACAEAGISVGCFRRWRASRGVMPTPAQMSAMRSAR